MDLLDRYLRAVRTHLPASQQDDILKELKENLRAQMEDKEAELRRPLDEDEVAAILKKHSHPIFVLRLSSVSNSFGGCSAWGATERR
jgi:hypothetical protein